MYVEVYTNLFDFREITIITAMITKKQNRNLLKENEVLQQKLQESEAYNRKLNEYYELAFREGFEKKEWNFGVCLFICYLIKSACKTSYFLSGNDL